MKLSSDTLFFRPDEGTLLDTASLEAITKADHSGLQVGLALSGLPRHGFVLQGMRATLRANAVWVTEGSAVLPDGNGQLVVASLLEPAEVALPVTGQGAIVASVGERRHVHEPSGLNGAGKRLWVRLEMRDWATLNLEENMPVAHVNLDAGRVDNDVCRLLQPDDPEVLELVRRLREIMAARLNLEGARGQLEFQGQVQENLSARDFVYLSAIQSVVVQLRSRPGLSIERVRLVSELALQVRTLYRSHPRLRELIREIVGVGYVDHDHARQLRLESPAARFYNECYSPNAWRGNENEG